MFKSQRIVRILNFCRLYIGGLHRMTIVHIHRHIKVFHYIVIYRVNFFVVRTLMKLNYFKHNKNVIPLLSHITNRFYIDYRVCIIYHLFTNKEFGFQDWLLSRNCLDVCFLLWYCIFKLNLQVCRLYIGGLHKVDWIIYIDA